MDPVTPLERRCRRLLWLLPPVERDARGEELVGLLCDVSGGRSRPHHAEVLALVWLALRLRLRTTRTPVVIFGTAVLIAAASQSLGRLIDTHTGAVLARHMGPFRDGLVLDLGVSLVPLVVAVAWLAGAVRVALAVCGTLLAVLTALFATTAGDLMSGPYAADNMRTLLLFMSAPVGVTAMLVAARRLGWTPPRPLALWLVLLGLSVLAWKGVGEWGRHGVSFAPWTYWAVSVVGLVAGAAAGLWLARRHRWPVMVIAAMAGGGAGELLAGWPPVANTLVVGVFHDQPLPLALVLAAVGGPAHLLMERLRPTRPAEDPSPPEGLRVAS